MSHSLKTTSAFGALALLVLIGATGCGTAPPPKGSISANTLSPTSGAGLAASASCASVSEDLGVSGFNTSFESSILGTYQGSITGTSPSGASQSQSYTLLLNILPLNGSNYPVITFISSGQWGNWNSSTCAMPNPVSIGSNESMYSFTTPTGFLSGIGGSTYPNTALELDLAIDNSGNLDLGTSEVNLRICPSSSAQCSSQNDVPSIWLMQGFNKTN